MNRQLEQQATQESISVEALRTALSQLLTEQVPAELASALRDYITILSSRDSTSIVMFEDVLSSLEAAISLSKDDYLPALLVVQSIQDLCDEPCKQGTCK